MSTVKRLEETSSYIINSPFPIKKFSIIFLTTGAVEKKSILFKISACADNDEELSPSEFSCVFSPSLKSPFVYMPSTEKAEGAISDQIVLERPAKIIRLKPIRWASSGEDPNTLMGAIGLCIPKTVDTEECILFGKKVLL